MTNMPDAMVQAACMGQPLTGELVLDAHMHNARTANFFSRYTSGEQLIQQMDCIGVSAGIISNLWPVGQDPHASVLSLCRAYPGRFYGYVSPNPNESDFCTQLDAYIDQSAFVGIKLHPALHQADFFCPQYQYAYRQAASRQMPVLLHTWGVEEISHFYRLAKEFPHTVFILGHSGGEEKAVAQAIQVAAKYANVYLDTACSHVWQGAIEAMVQTVGADKILYGSDASWNSMEAAVGRILFAEIPIEAKRKILGQNAARLFQIPTLCEKSQL